MSSGKAPNPPGHREDHWIYLDRAWAHRLGVKRSAGLYRIRGRDLLSRLAREHPAPDAGALR